MDSAEQCFRADNASFVRETESAASRFGVRRVCSPVNVAPPLQELGRVKRLRRRFFLAASPSLSLERTSRHLCHELREGTCFAARKSCNAWTKLCPVCALRGQSGRDNEDGTPCQNHDDRVRLNESMKPQAAPRSNFRNADMEAYRSRGFAPDLDAPLLRMSPTTSLSCVGQETTLSYRLRSPTSRQS